MIAINSKSRISYLNFPIFKSVFFFFVQIKKHKNKQMSPLFANCDSVLWDGETVQDACTPRPSRVLMASTDYVCPIFVDSGRQIVRLLLIKKLSHYKIEFKFFSPLFNKPNIDVTFYHKSTDINSLQYKLHALNAL